MHGRAGRHHTCLVLLPQYVLYFKIFSKFGARGPKGICLVENQKISCIIVDIKTIGLPYLVLSERAIFFSGHIPNVIAWYYIDSSGGKATRNDSDFGYQQCSGITQVEQGFSSFFAIFDNLSKWSAEKSSNLTKIWRKMKKRLVRLAFTSFFG